MRGAPFRILAVAFVLAACGDAAPAPRVHLPVIVDAAFVEEARTNLGYDVTLTEARAAVEDLRFAVGGEVHAAALRGRLREVLLPTAHAHPGHQTGGEVTGELRGRFLLDWLGDDGATLGEATLLAGRYESFDFTFSHALPEDGVDEADPLLHHTAVFAGTASRNDAAIPFEAIVRSPPGRVMSGAPFVLEVTEETGGRLGVQLRVTDPFEGRVLFDDLDFAALPAGDDGVVRIAPDAGDADLDAAYFQLRRRFQTHDHFYVTYRP
jgi:hypothetical protein